MIIKEKSCLHLLEEDGEYFTTDIYAVISFKRNDCNENCLNCSFFDYKNLKRKCGRFESKIIFEEYFEDI